MMMMMVLCSKAGPLAFTPPGDEMSDIVSRCLLHKQLQVSNLSNVATHAVTLGRFKPATFRLQGTEHPPTPPINKPEGGEILA